MQRPFSAASGIAVNAIALAGILVGAQESRTQLWQVPLTPWGHPDLQGIWTTDAEIGIPVERPVQYGERAQLTDQEFEAKRKPRTEDATESRRAAASDNARTSPDLEQWYGKVGNASRRTSWVVDPPDGRVPAYTAAARQRMIPNGTMLGFVGGSFTDDSRARWEGTTLVVDVTNFSDRATFMKSGSTLHLIERYTRVDADTLTVSVTVDDPTRWVRPWTFMVTGKKDPEYWQIFEGACHQANYAMEHILSGARARERDQAAPPARKRD